MKVIFLLFCLIIAIQSILPSKEMQQCKAKIDKSILLFEKCKLNDWKKFKCFKGLNRTYTVYLPSEKCKHKAKTLYFENDYNFNQNYKINKSRIKNLTIYDKNFFFTARNKSIVFKAIKQMLKSHNITFTTEFSLSNLIWVQSGEWARSTIMRMNSLLPYQKFNKVPFGLASNDKVNLYKCYKKLQIKFPQEYNFMTESYILEENPEIILQKFKNYKINLSDLWLYKPSSGMQGIDIKFIHDYNDIPNKGFLSKYISYPDLVNNLKYDIRVFVLIAGTNPLRIYLYKEGFAKLCTEEYNLKLDSLNNKFIHITNYHFNKKNPKYTFNDDINSEKGHLWTLSTLARNFKKNGKDFSKVWEEIKDIMIKTFITFMEDEYKVEKKYQLDSRKFFQIIGPDIIIDKNLKPWLLEVNRMTDLNWGHKMSEVVCNQMLRDTWNIIGFPFFNHSNPNLSMEGMEFPKDSPESRAEDVFCEFDRPFGGYELLFPLKNNINKYKKFIPNTPENVLLWNKLLNSNDDY